MGEFKSGYFNFGYFCILLLIIIFKVNIKVFSKDLNKFKAFEAEVIGIYFRFYFRGSIASILITKRDY